MQESLNIIHLRLTSDRKDVKNFDAVGVCDFILRLELDVRRQKKGERREKIKPVI